MPSGPRRSAVVLALALLGGCTIHNTAPDGWLPTVPEAPMDVYGSWLHVELGNRDSPRRVLGELLGASRDTLWVLAWYGPEALATSSILAGRVYHYDPGNWRVALVAVGGMLISPPLLGGLSGLAIPLWGITGGLVGDWQYRLASDRLPPGAWEDLAGHARFPQGIPSGLDLKGIEPRMPLDGVSPLHKSYKGAPTPAPTKPRERAGKVIPDDF